MRICIKYLLILLIPLFSMLANGGELKALPDKAIFIPQLKQKYQRELTGLVPTLMSDEDYYVPVIGTDVAIMMLPFRTKEEDFYTLSLIFAVIDVEKEQIVQSTFHKDIAESDAIYISDYKLDVVTFQDISKDVIFAIYIDTLGSSRPNPMASTYLYLYAVQNEQISLLFDALELMDSIGETNMTGGDGGYNNHHTLTYIPSKKHQEYPVLKFQSIHSHTQFNSDDRLDKTTKTKGKNLELVYMNGRYENLDLKYQEERAKNGVTQEKKFYQSLIEAKPVSLKNVRLYNDIAYYLEQNNHNEEAVIILNEVLRKFDERVVAYLNLADAFWTLGKKNDAYVNYWQYKNLMHKKKKQRKIPERVHSRLDAHKKTFETLFIGRWKNQECGYVVDIEEHDQILLYTLQTDKRKLQGELYISMDLRAIYIAFKGIEWSADFGGPLPMEDSIPLRKIQKLPVGIEALFDKEQEEFVIQNSGNASYYYVKLEEGCEKYIYFKR